MGRDDCDGCGEKGAEERALCHSAMMCESCAEEADWSSCNHGPVCQKGKHDTLIHESTTRGELVETGLIRLVQCRTHKIAFTIRLPRALFIKHRGELLGESVCC